MTALRFEGLSVWFDRYSGLLRRSRKMVLHDITLDLAPGEVLGVVGASGAGKSLLAEAVLGALPANAGMSGRICLGDTALTGAALAAARGRLLAMAPQGIDALDPLLPVAAQIARFARLSGMPRAEAEARAQEVLSRYGLAAHGAAYPHELSGGMARRVLLATATSGGAQWLMADEPTVGLDPETAVCAMRHLRDIADEGRGVLAISHDLRALLAIADRIAILDAGALVAVHPAADFRGDGAALGPGLARRLWRAQPCNGIARMGSAAAAA